MSDYGLSLTGFKRKRLDQLLIDLNDEMRVIFGDNLNLDPQSPDGQVNGAVAESQANLWEIAEQSFNAFKPSVATGASLSSLVQLNGITRKEATFSTATIDVTGTNGTLIPTGSIVSTNDTQAQFSTDDDITIAGGVGSSTVTSIVSGDVHAVAGTLTLIDTPITGWDTVTNGIDAIEGENQETDAELRIRRKSSIATGATAILEAMLASVLNITGVSSAVVLENDSNVTDGNGVPRKSFNVVARGGDDAELAGVIWDKKPIGILAFGTTTEVITDSQGFDHDISFSRPVDVDIYIDISITNLEGYPIDGDDRIKQAIVDFANGDLIEGYSYGIGDNVIYSELYIPINSIPGVQVDSLFLDSAPSPSGTTTLIIGDNQVSVFDTSRINIT